MKKIISGGTGEFKDKKSRFIANIYHIEDEDMAVKIIEQLRKKYWDARHNCYAYVLGGKSEIQRFSDDGEPSGTAGKPILECMHTLCKLTKSADGQCFLGSISIRSYKPACSKQNTSKISCHNTQTVSAFISRNYFQYRLTCCVL